MPTLGQEGTARPLLGMQGSHRAGCTLSGRSPSPRVQPEVVGPVLPLGAPGSAFRKARKVSTPCQPHPSQCLPPGKAGWAPGASRLATTDLACAASPPSQWPRHSWCLQPPQAGVAPGCSWSPQSPLRCSGPSPGRCVWKKRQAGCEVALLGSQTHPTSYSCFSHPQGLRSRLPHLAQAHLLFLQTCPVPGHPYRLAPLAETLHTGRAEPCGRHWPSRNSSPARPQHPGLRIWFIPPAQCWAPETKTCSEGPISEGHPEQGA